ncbi:MAG: hypothetical protein A3C54_03005 [Deltaproteobacteria bacterium RIFCSPHIGHO2_02_FULL_60_17]|nr:MAG: hypothetical protein A3C54_03005 [Deltaproteobacteria bacterium RIFCSPHIGHO2_02_FULL_60_17]
MDLQGRAASLFRACGNEAGYLWEIPLLVLLIAVVVSIVAPLLPSPWNLIPIALLVAACIFFLIYNFFFAGWMPGKRK